MEQKNEPLKGGHAKEFEEHWESNNTASIALSKIVAANTFLQQLYAEIEEHKGHIKILDAGCGDAVHAKAIAESEFDDMNAHFVGIDLSMAVQRRNSEANFANWDFFHGDITKLPFHDFSFDAVFSYGVICYTDEPAITFKELCRCLKKDGLIGLWVYPKKNSPLNLLFSTVRNLCQFGGKKITKYIADLIVLFLPVLPTQSKVTLFNSSWKQCREVVLVNIAPPKLYFPTTGEVKNWFIENDCEIINIDEDNPTTVWGRKR